MSKTFSNHRRGRFANKVRKYKITSSHGSIRSSNNYAANICEPFQPTKYQMSFFCRYPWSDSIPGFLVLPSSVIRMCVRVRMYLYSTDYVLTVAPWAGKRTTIPSKIPGSHEFFLPWIGATIREARCNLLKHRATIHETSVEGDLGFRESNQRSSLRYRADLLSD